MRTFITDVDGITVIRPSGRLNAAATRTFEDAVLKAAGDATSILFDFSRVTYVASGALRVVLTTAKGFADRDAVALCCLNPGVREVFHMAGFTTIFEIHDERESALKALAANWREREGR